ncbi:hypothetical protein LR48_Vigan2362s000100 [Vigna angularis]|uniref:Uncharacterized protein n=1 Tax=Vigna angularis var. angularis TaxID=157739 RepID=A0A0S3SXZ9_PHAAN|nr:hypothetical protein LR48_Vigan2362s000100 [Vigna angularis]BAT97111.1 hypothetical protein VIGAN_09046800 [Vigna angularis var. angularis]BAT97685.1 hypothetical protein VIGAN_09120400 [Vigna angularis var. angularis]BAU03131.1 hypothetical protein VIGAN_UM016600 [Vigna angularis var. angularis]
MKGVTSSKSCTSKSSITQQLPCPELGEEAHRSTLEKLHVLAFNHNLHFHGPVEASSLEEAHGHHMEAVTCSVTLVGAWEVSRPAHPARGDVCPAVATPIQGNWFSMRFIFFLSSTWKYYFFMKGEVE